MKNGRANIFLSLLGGGILLILLLSGGLAGAGEYYGGYDTNTIARRSVDLLVTKKVLSQKDADLIHPSGAVAGADPMVSGPQVVEMYKRLTDLLVARDVLDVDEIGAIYKRAAESGGLKVGGLNLLILEVAFLASLDKAGVISKSEAQSILDHSRR